MKYWLLDKNNGNSNFRGYSFRDILGQDFSNVQAEMGNLAGSPDQYHCFKGFFPYAGLHK